MPHRKISNHYNWEEYNYADAGRERTCLLYTSLTEVFYDKDDDSVIITQVVTYVGQINKSVAATRCV